MSRTPILTAALLGLLAGSAGASPFTVGDLDAASSYEFKLAAQVNRAGSDKRVEGPVIDLTAPLREGLETSASFGRGRLAGSRWGSLDTELAIKWEVVHRAEVDGGFGLSMEPTLIVPSGTRGLSGDEYRLGLPLVFGSNWGQFALRGLLGYEHGLKTDDGSLQFGALVKVTPIDRLTVGVEIVDEASTRRPHEPASTLELGFNYALTPKLDVQGRVGRSLNTPDQVRATDSAVFLQFSL